MRNAVLLLFLLVFFTGIVSAVTENDRLLAGDGTAFDRFGYSVSIDGDTLVIGAPFANDPVTDSGAAYVFTRSGGTWSQQAKPGEVGGSRYDYFGYSVSIDGDTLVIGAYNDDDRGANSGAAYVFKRSGTNWIQEAKLTAGDGVRGDHFGYAVSIDGDTIVVGARDDNTPGGVNAGSAYVFTRSGGIWSQEAKLTASDGAESDWFGESVSIDGDTIVVGARQDDDKGENSGAAYVFTRSGGIWSQQAKLLAGDGAAGDHFGLSVSISGNSVVIGAPFSDEGTDNSGAAYVFTRSGTNWGQEAKLTASDGADSDYFGYAVSIDGDTLVIGAYFGDGVVDNSGAAYVFTRSGTTWTQTGKLVVSDGADSDRFGYAVSIDGNTIAVGAPGDDDKGKNSGAAYVFYLAGMPASIPEFPTMALPVAAVFALLAIMRMARRG